jgi:hypothetical protein
MRNGIAKKLENFASKNTREFILRHPVDKKYSHKRGKFLFANSSQHFNATICRRPAQSCQKWARFSLSTEGIKQQKRRN